MAHFYFLLGLGLIVLIALVRHIWRMAINWLHPPYCADNLLFTRSQRNLKTALEQAVGREYRIYGRIRVADVIGVRGRLTRREQEQALARLDGLSFDFLLCAPETTALVGAIVLISRSRWPTELLRQRRLRQICTAATLPLLCIEVRDTYSAAELAAQIFAVLQTRWLGVTPHDPIPKTVQSAPAAAIDQDEWDAHPRIDRREPVLAIHHAPELALEPKFTIHTTEDVDEEMPWIAAEKRAGWRS